MKQLSFLTLFIALAVQGQQFKPAEITLRNDETISATVSYNTPIYTPQVFDVKTDSDKAKKMGINELKTVTITDKTKFIKANLEISRHPENLQRLEYHSDFNVMKETRMIEQLVFGKYNLYKYTDDLNKAFFYSTDQEPLIKPLLFKEYFVASGKDEGAKSSNRQYLQDLKQINCGNADYNNVRYVESSLVAYFNKINECNGETNQSFQKQKPYAEHKVFGLYSTYSDGFDTSFGGGYEFEYHLPFLNYSFSVAAAPGFFKYTNQKQGTPFTKKSELSLPLMARYYPVKTNDFKAYVSYSILNFVQDYTTYSGPASDANSNSFHLRNFFELGLRFKTVEAFTRFYTLGESPLVLGVKYNFLSAKK